MTASSDDEQDEVAQATQWLERVTGDPMAEAVAGRIRVDAVSAPEGRRRYQECRVEATAEAPGIPPTQVVLEVVIDRRFWPRAGQLLPARVSVSRPTAVEVGWDALRR